MNDSHTNESLVLKAYNSFFFVETKEGIRVLKLRGKLKKGDFICPGDRVRYLPQGQDAGIIESRLPRKNVLSRPPVANIDQVVLLFAAKEPDLSDLLLNRFLVLAEWSEIPQIIIAINKIDLGFEEIRKRLKIYESIGYKVLFLSAAEKIGTGALRPLLKNKVTVFAGPSGVGKSSVINAVEPNFALKTGNISDKIKRGKHTTRHSELLPFAGGYLADTPGFSAVDLSSLPKSTLPFCFPEFLPLIPNCRFTPCTHSHEPDCAIKNALGKTIDKSRYEAYLKILQA